MLIVYYICCAASIFLRRFPMNKTLVVEIAILNRKPNYNGEFHAWLIFFFACLKWLLVCMHACEHARAKNANKKQGRRERREKSICDPITGTCQIYHTFTRPNITS